MLEQQVDGMGADRLETAFLEAVRWQVDDDLELDEPVVTA